MNNVKNISIKGFLAGRGITPQAERGGYGMYLSPLREERTPSFKVDYGQNLWYDFGLGEGGSIIDLVARMEDCSVGEAIRRLEGGTWGGGVPRASMNSEVSSFYSHRKTSHENTTTSPQHHEPASSRISIVSVGELGLPALVEYLRERGIDLAAAKKYCHEVRYSIGDREYFAIGFRNDTGGWELRNRNFKGSSTPKNITTIRNGSDTVMVFEGFIDFLSYLSLKQNPSPTIDTAVLNGSQYAAGDPVPRIVPHHPRIPRQRRGRTENARHFTRIVTRLGGGRSVGVLPEPQRPERLLEGAGRRPD